MRQGTSTRFIVTGAAFGASGTLETSVPELRRGPTFRPPSHSYVSVRHRLAERIAESPYVRCDEQSRSDLFAALLTR